MAVPVPVVSLGEYEELKAEVSNTFERRDPRHRGLPPPTPLYVLAVCLIEQRSFTAKLMLSL